MEYANEYYLKILITKVNNKLDFPILTKTGENGERLWVNDMEGEEVYVDRSSIKMRVLTHFLNLKSHASHSSNSL